MTDWLTLFKQAADQIRHQTLPLFATEAGRRGMGRGAGGDNSKYIDTLAEGLVVKTLQAANTPCTLITEESGRLEINGGGKHTVILDSIDGTTNATRGIPFVTTSIAHATGNMLHDIDAALVHDIYHNIDYTAEKGKGAHASAKPLKTSDIEDLGKAITTLNLTPREKMPQLLQQLVLVLCGSYKLRVLGCTTLEICGIASGTLDVFLDSGGLTRAPDMAASYLILREAGGVVASTTGGELDIPLRADARAAFIATANRPLCDQVVECLETCDG